MQDGAVGIPVGCSVQYDSVEEDQAVYWNAAPTSTNVRALTGEFRVLCAQTAACKSGHEEKTFVPGLIIGCTAKWDKDKQGAKSGNDACGPGPGATRSLIRIQEYAGTRLRLS